MPMFFLQTIQIDGDKIFTEFHVLAFTYTHIIEHIMTTIFHRGNSIIIK